MIDFICFNDEHGNIYKLCEHDKDFYVKKDTAKIFEGQLIKLKSIDKVPIKPYIYKNNLFLFNYDRGIEIHKLDGTEKKFIDARACINATFADDILFVERTSTLLTIDINTGEILHKRNIPEGQHVIALKDYVLFYTIYRNKTFLYNIKTKNYVELKNFFKNFGIIPKILKKEDKLIVFYSSSETSSTITHKNGVYIYDLSNGYGYQYCNLDNKISAYGHNFLDIIDFSFNAPLNTDKTIFCDTHNYWNYLRFVFEQFGIYAMLYRLDKEKADKEIFDDQEIPQDKRSGLLNMVNYFSTKMAYFPTTNCEFKSLMEDLEVASGFLKEIFTDN